MRWQKTAVAQFIIFPPYLVALFRLMGVPEQHPNIGDKIRHRVPEDCMGKFVYWPSNFQWGINFGMVPATLGVPYLAASAGVWSSYLSWANARDDKTKMHVFTRS
jgi:hypothetical protein